MAFAGNAAEAYIEIKSIIENPERADQMSRTGSRYVEKFDWPRIAKSHGSVYQAVADAAKARRGSARAVA